VLVVTVSAVASQARNVPRNFAIAMYSDCPRTVSRRRRSPRNSTDIKRFTPKPVYSPSGSCNSENDQYTAG
jgi:hypothetical protein